MSQPVVALQTPIANRSDPIPGYVLRKRIGAGGYGEVWEAEAPGGLVKAIKFVYGLMDESRAAREYKSLSLIKGVRHPFLLSLERIEVIDGQLLIVTELADGSLKDRFEECLKGGQTGISREELLAHLHDAADALDYMNSQHSLQHLDVKPENLLLVGGRIKVADFGLVKEIQEVSASLMGGLTPTYAPPEVFDARPSRRSDQYSLAIVYQEMLTGILPFPGKTAAQLATQHLTAKPRLGSLPVADQPIIERALSKEPLQRFASCREMVEALMRGRPEEAAQRANVAPANGSGGIGSTAVCDGPSPTESVTSAAGLQPAATEQEMFRRLESAEQATAYASQGRYEVAEQAAEQAVLPAAVEPRQLPASLVDLPPLDVELTAHACRPTLFLGIGGLAGKTLQQLRRRLADQSDAKQREKFSFLLLDTDPHDLIEATHGPQGSALKPEETLALPIRKSADYRNDSSKYLDWLSRRWLFNIPRSQQTEGIRPFGRLAFVDHGELLMRRLRGAIAHLTTAAKSSGSEAAPRVIVLGSSSGGAASGMVLDVAFAVRQILDESQAPGGVDLLLLHGTGRQPAAQELAGVNTFSLLTELNQFLRTDGSYPGDFACGLKSRSASERAIENLYLVHLGQELGSDQFLAACDPIAEYLYLDSATPTGAYLNACRSAEPQEKRQDVTLRTFGLCQIGFSEATINRGVESLCRAVAVQWFGEPKAPAAVTFSEQITDGAKEKPASPAAIKDAALELLAAREAARLGLELDSVVQRLYLLAAEELGGQPNDVFQRIIRESPANPQAIPPVEKWFAGSSRFFGARGSEAEPASPSPLQSAVVKRLAQVASPLGEQLRNWLLAVPEEPAARVYGGRWCVKWFQTHLKIVAEKAKETQVQIGSQLSGLEQKLALAAKTPHKGATKGKNTATSAETLFLQHCQLRLYQLAAQVASQFTQGVASYVSQANDQLHDLGRDVKHLESQFAESEQAPGDELQAAALAQLRQDEAVSTLFMDQYFQEAVFSAAGFRTVLQGGAQRHELLALLRQQARQVVLASLRRIDLLALTRELGKPDQNGTSKLGSLLASAQPWLQQVGGERRLLCVAGQAEGENLTPAAFSGLISSACFKQPPAVIPATTSQIVFCYELGNVPLAHAAGQIIDHCPHYAQAASRLHVRTDVVWRELSL